MNFPKSYPVSISWCIVFLIGLNSIRYAQSIVIPYSTKPSDIQFLLYTKGPGGEQVTHELVHGNVASVKDSPFNPDLPTVLLIHGYWCDRNSNFPSKVRDAYLETLPTTQNYIVVDWGRLSHPTTAQLFEGLVFPVTYLPIVLENIPIVSRRVAEFIQFLIDSELSSLCSLHIVGHSLGAHISGFAGQLIQDNGKGKVGRISGLDPAGPLFDQGGLSLQRGLKKEDASFVDVYHTAMGTRGDTSFDGHVDFYPNGGVAQPQCPQDMSQVTAITDPIGRGSCSHEYSSDIYAATIRGRITGCRCSYKWKGAQLEECMKTCPDPVLAGEKCPETAHGIYYFRTDDNKSRK